MPKVTQLYIPEQPIPFPKQIGMLPDQKGSGKYHPDFAFEYMSPTNMNYLFPVGMWFWEIKTKKEIYKWSLTLDKY